MYLRWLLPVCVLFFGCASAPSSDVPGVTQAGGIPTVTIHPTTRGFTICRDGEPETWLKHPEAYSPRTQAHEAAHRQQAREHPEGCEGFMQDEQARYDGEIEAFCDGALADHRAGVRDLEQGLARAAYNIWFLYGFERTHSEIKRDLREECKT